MLFLGDDQWSPESLRGATLRAFGVRLPFEVRRHGTPLPPFDFDTPRAAFLDSSDYVITTRTLDAAPPPVGWRIIRTTPHYELFTHARTAPPRGLGCAQARRAPVASSAWHSSQGTVLATLSGAVRLPVGYSAFATIRLPPGNFELSLTYASAVAVTLRAASASMPLTPTLEPVGPLWRAGVISSRGGALALRVDVGRGHVPFTVSAAAVGIVYAVPTARHDPGSGALAGRACRRS